MKHRLIGVAVVSLLTCTSGLGALPAAAATTSLVGGGMWALVVTLPQYPCVFGCAVTASGYFTGSITALDANNHPTYVATWSAGTTPNLQAGPLTYNESCGSIPFAPPQTGSASGSFTITGGTLKPASPGGSTTAQLTGWIDVARFGGAVVNITVSNVQLLDGGNTMLATAQSAGVAPGLFGWPIPTVAEMESNPLPPNCANEEAVSVAVVGTYAQPT